MSGTRIWAGIGSWEIPESWKGKLVVGESISGTIMFHPYQLQQMIIPSNQIEHIGCAVIDIQGKIDTLTDHFFMLDVGVKLLCPSPPYSWMCEKHTFEGFGITSLQLSDNFEARIPNFRIQKIWSDMSFFSRLRMSESKPINSGAKAPEMKKVIQNVMKEHAPRTLKDVPQSTPKGVDHYVLELQALDSEPLSPKKK